MPILAPASKRELKRMRRCRDMLNMVITDTRNRRVATARMDNAYLQPVLLEWLC